MELCKEKYAEKFEMLTKKQGVSWWEAFFEKSDFNDVVQAIEILADQHKARFEGTGVKLDYPQLDDLKDVYWMIKDKDKRPIHQAKCPMCNNTGWIKTVQMFYNNRQFICDPREVVAVPNGGSIGVYASPCTCHRSSREYPQSFKNECVSKSFGAGDTGTGLERDYVWKCLEKGGKDKEYVAHVNSTDAEVPKTCDSFSVKDSLSANNPLDGYQPR